MKGLAATAVVLLVGLIPPGTASANQATLDSLIELAMTNNPDLLAADYQIAAAEYRAKASGALPDPTVGIAAMNLPHSSFAFDETPMTGVQLGITQMIPWPGKLSSQSRIASIDERLSVATSNVIERSIERRVSQAYYEYAYWEAAQRSITRSLELAQAISAAAETRYANGEVSAQDLLRSQTSVQRLEVRLLRARQQSRSALLELSSLVGTSDLDTTLSASMPDLPVREQFDSVSGNPQLVRASRRIDFATAEAGLARSEYYPDFSAGIDYRFRQEVPGDPVKGEDFLTFRVGFSLPLWFFSKQRHQTRAAEQMVEVARARYEAVELHLRRRFEDAVQTYRTTSRSLDYYQTEILPQSRAAFEAAEIAYEVGSVDFNALLSAQLELLEVELEQLELTKQAHQTLALIDELAGVGEDQ